MKKINFILCIVFLLLYINSINAQTTQSSIKSVPNELKTQIEKGKAFNQYELFEIDDTKEFSGKIDPIVDNYTILSLNTDVLQQIIEEEKNTIGLTVMDVRGKSYDLELLKADLFTSGFSVRTSSNSKVEPTGVHYRGIISGDYNSLVALSFFEDEVMGFITEGNTQLVLGKLRDGITQHILYYENQLKVSSDFSCEVVPDENVTYSMKDLTFSETQKNNSDNCVGVYIEVDYDIFVDKGANTTNYVTGLFNQSATIYANDGITLTLSEIFIWDTNHAYTGACSREILADFQAFRTSFNGDIGHLVSYAGGGGIAAGFSGLCNPDVAKRLCYSGIYSGYDIVPTYSWSVYVFTHEMGHLLGSRHTHACVWNGNDTAIDGCGGCQEEPNPPPHPGGCGGIPGFDCSYCPTPPVPPTGGTIMSYCHLNPVGINFNNGFGPQPSAVMLNNIANAVCLTSCDECPVDITHTGTINSALYEASNSITSTATIGNNQNVTYDAGNLICLDDVFIADSGNGTVFLAHIDGCDVLQRTAPENDVVENESMNHEKRSVIDTAEEYVSIKNYPNPFTGETTIEFTLREDTPVTLSISDVTGKQIAVLLNNEQKIQGTHQVIFNGNGYPAGMYYYIMQAGDYIATQRMTLMK